MGHDLESTVVAAVDAGGEVAVVAVELGLVAHEPADVVVAGGRHRHREVAVLLGHVEQVVAESSSQPRGSVVERERARARHRTPAPGRSHHQKAADAGPPNFSSMSSSLILLCSSMMPCSSASGRGGHPGTYTSIGTIWSTPLVTE